MLQIARAAVANAAGVRAIAHESCFAYVADGPFRANLTICEAWGARNRLNSDVVGIIVLKIPTAALHAAPWPGSVTPIAGQIARRALFSVGKLP